MECYYESLFQKGKEKTPNISLPQTLSMNVTWMCISIKKKSAPNSQFGGAEPGFSHHQAILDCPIIQLNSDSFNLERASDSTG